MGNIGAKDDVAVAVRVEKWLVLGNFGSIQKNFIFVLRFVLGKHFDPIRWITRPEHPAVFGTGRMRNG
jgi:hypothetical protein